MAVKKRTEPDWQDLRVFLALGRHGSLSGAARALGVNHATIARRIQSLEASIGERLVDRRPEGYVLTSAGTDTLAAASDMEAAAQTLGRLGSDGTPRGLVRISAPPALAHGFLIARVAALTTLYPGLDIELATDIRAVSLERHQADIAIRLSRPDDGDVIARPLLTIGYGFYATAETCRSIAGGGEPIFVGFDEADVQLPEAAWLTRHFPRARIAFRAGNQFGQAIAAGAGAGIALLPHYIGRTGHGLMPCPLEFSPPSRDTFLLTRRRDRRDRAVATVVERIQQMFAEAHALFE